MTEENFKKAANSAIGKKLEKVIENKVANASEKAATSLMQKLKIPLKENFPKKISENFSNSSKIENKKIGSKRKLEFPENFTLAPKVNRKRKILAVVPKVGSRKKGKRRKIGRGIILE